MKGTRANRLGPLLAATTFVVLALALSVVIWPAVAASAKIAFFALGFAAGAAAVRPLVARRARDA